MTRTLPPFPNSLWTQSAAPAVETPSLAHDITCDVAIVGGGYAGLHAALTFAQAGLDVVLLEAGPLGYGGSGRNGGAVSAKFRRGFSDIAGQHGVEMARRMHRIAEQSVDHLVETLDTHHLTGAQFRQVGALKCAHSAKALAHAQIDAEWTMSTLGESGLRLLDRAAVEAETGATGFVGGVLAQKGGTLQPLGYLRDLAASVQSKGVQIFTLSAVSAISEGAGGVELQCAGRVVSARKAVIATDAYSSLAPATRDIARCLVPFRSAMIATERLPPDLDARLLVEQRSYTETRRMMRWFRKVDGRILFGGRGALGAVDDPAAFRKLHRAMLAIFPDLKGIPVAARWSGHVALTFDALPQAGMLSPNIGFAAGFNGAGVAMSGFVGHGVARQMLGHRFDLGLMERDGPKTVPFHAFRSVGVRTMTFGYEIMDALGL
ncbi:MAG: FAD-binding oxidoreductase [Gemmobacter sp.]|nr:FAD-binding oxidoreductase [Gemmobacter sp.]